MLEIGGNISTDGKLSVYNQQLLNEWRVANAGKDIVLTLKVRRKNRSSKQNAYYWGAVIPMITEAINRLGNDFSQDDTHNFLKAEFNAKQIEVIEGHYIDMPQSTSKLDTKAFMTYIENIQFFASSMLGLYIPSPNEQVSIDFSLNQ
jgi:hypothetical protein